MAVISFKDYIFSFRRGNLFENLKIVLNQLLKKILFLCCALVFKLTSNKKVDELKINKLIIYIPINSGMGDIIMSNQFFKAVREKFKNAEIIIFTSNGLMIDPLFFNSLIDIKNKSILNQLSIIRRNNADLFLLPEKSIVGSILFLLNNAKYKLGYLSCYSLDANFKINYLQFIPHLHHYYLKSYHLIKAFQSSEINEIVSYSPDLSYINFLPSKKDSDYILFIPCDKWGSRSVGIEYSKIILEEVLKSKFKIYLSGGEESKNRNIELFNFYPEFKDRIFLDTNLPLNGFIDVVHKSSAVICGDGGALNIAVSLKKPSFSYWGPTFYNKILPDKLNSKSVQIFAKENCPVESCYNMEHKPFCKKCLRLDNIPEFSNKINLFLKSIS